MIESWRSLFSTDRVSVIQEDCVKQKVSCSPSEKKGEERSPFERDYCRIVYSSLFRRLAGKTQILPDAGIDHVRNRLTHSIEVSTIAGSILREFDGIMRKERGLVLDNIESAYWIVRTAGLSHDIGNPPYGHAGEQAIREWGAKYFAKHPELSAVERDFRFFDGNAQSFRLLSRDNLGFSDSIRLTVTGLASIVKYPYSVLDERCEKKFKSNAFKTENDILDAVMRRLNLSDTKGRYRRHPLSFILEAADDISYILSDLEDAVYGGIITRKKKDALFMELLTRAKCNAQVSASSSAIQSAVASYFIRDYARAFYNSLVEIFTNEKFSGKDLENSLSKHLRDWLADIGDIRKKIISDKKVKLAEQRGSRVIKSFLDEMSLIVPCVGENARKLTKKAETIIDQTFGGEFFEENKDKSKEWWLHAILDYLSGMTDRYLMNWDVSKS